MTTVRMELFFQPPDTGVQVGKTGYISSATNTTKCALAESRTITLNNTLVVVDTQLETYVYFELPVATANLLQANFNQNGAQASLGSVTGVIEFNGNRLFFPTQGLCWYDGTDLQVRLKGSRAYYKA